MCGGDSLHIEGLMRHLGVFMQVFLLSPSNSPAGALPTIQQVWCPCFSAMETEGQSNCPRATEFYTQSWCCFLSLEK